MRIRIKLILLIGALVFIGVVVIFTYQYFSNQYLIKFFNTEVKEQKENFQDILRLKQATLKALADDYTIWDAMVDFTKTRDKRWAQENIDAGLDTFHANAAWVYGLDGTLIYSANNVKLRNVHILIPLREAVLQSKGTIRFLHFFVQTSRGIMEVQGAPIQPSSDTTRSSPPSGYFFAGKLWDDVYLKEIAKLTHSQIAWISGEAKDVVDPVRGFFQFSQDLLGPDGKPAGRFQAKMESNEIEVINTAIQRTVVFFLFAMMVVFVALAISLFSWVNVPLRSLGLALQTQDIIHLEKLRNKNNEFGDIARLMVDFFIQREALHKSEERYRLIFQTAGSLIVSLDMAGLIVTCNNKIRDLLGYKITEVINQPFVRFVEPEYTAVLENLIKGAPLNTVQIYELSMKGKNDKPVEVLLNASRMEQERGIICVIHDITQRKHAEAELKRLNMELAKEEVKLRNLLLNLEKKNIELQETRTQFLQSAKMAAVGRLSAGVAHEIKNPLAIILLGIEKIDKEAGALTPGAQQAINMVKGATERANKVIKELLHFSRYSTVHLTPTDIHQVIGKAILLVENTTRLKNIQFQLNFSNFSEKIGADEILLEQVFLNLFVNAIDAMENKGGGSITIRTALKQIDSEMPPQVVVEIADTGSGMPPEVLARIFEPFFTTKDQGKGTGLGLSTVFMIMEKHRGGVQVESKEGEGSKFILTLHLATEQKQTEVI